VTGPPPIPLIAGFESTYLPSHDVDVCEINGHAERWRDDLTLVEAAGIRRLRYPIRWHRVEPEPGRFDWRHTDAVLAHMRERGLTPIVDLVHHTSYPRWLTGGFADARFRDAYLAYVERVVGRYPWIAEYTLFNEPFATLFLCGHEGMWPPYGRDMATFARLVANVLPAVAEASRIASDALPRGRHVWVDTCEFHAGSADERAQRHALVANDRRFALLDLMLGRGLDPARPFLAALHAADERSLEVAPGSVDVLGLDYYAHSEWFYDARGGRAPSPDPRGLAALAEEYWRRYQLPVILSETNIRGYASDRATWLRHTLGECETARARGVPLEGYCWFPLVDSCDWDSLLARHDGHIDPVGVYWLDADLNRHESSMSRSWSLAASGAPAASLPAYPLHPPAREWLAGWGGALSAGTRLRPVPADEHESRGTPHPAASPLSYGIAPTPARQTA
jgi:beta-glucosidase